ncbi:MAG TPA: FtsX-like permease family protein [Tepidisphaeraceae bacterium]|nr:FtsX-like permease family protein [Tepidisphaeraceae bacterium]
MPNLVRKLAVASMTTRKVRSGLTIAAIALSVSLVVAVTSGYASLEAAAFQYLTQYLGTTDATLARRNDPVGGVPQKVLDELRADPSVRHVDARLEMSLSIAVSDGRIDRVMAFGIFPASDQRITKLQFQSGHWFTGDSGDVAVPDSSLAAGLATNPGDTFTLQLPDKKLKMTVVGIVHKPSIGPAQMRTLYMPIRTLQEFSGNQGKYSRLFIELNGRESPAEFAARWRPRLAAIDPQLALTLSSDRLSQLNENLRGLHLLSYLGGAIAMLAAAFIIFSTLSMGVAERQRMLAMLRAVGAQKKQVAALVIVEAVALSAVGVIVGVPIGWAMVWVLAHWFNDLFVAGPVFSIGGGAFAAGAALLAAGAASLLPAYTASRTDPLEALSPLAKAPSGKPPWKFAIAGLVLISLDPLILLTNWPRWLAALPIARPDQVADWVKLIGHFVVGAPGVLLGFFLIAPLFVWAIERVLGPVVARLMGVRFALLRQQLSSGIWRAAGTAAALMVGLAVLIAMQINGRSMLAGWQLPDKFPDIFIITTGGLGPQQQQVLAETPGIDPQNILPIGIASPQYGTGLVGIGLAAITPDATMFIGVEPQKALRMMQLEFRQGNPTDAARMLQQGDALIVTQEFTTLMGLGLGQKFPLMTDLGEKTFKIAGVVWSPGIDVMVSTYDMAGEFDQRTAHTVFGSLEEGEKYFGIKKVYLLAADLQPGVDREVIVKRLEHRLGSEGLAVRDVRKIKAKIEGGFNRLLLLLSTVAFAAMAVASLGVANTIMAAIRSRQWQFGILRSIGLPRGQLLRLVVGEAILLGLVGAALGLVAGILMGIDARALSTVVTGYNPPLAVPWSIVAMGVAAVMGIAILASIWPAVRVSRREPLSLLQAGRAAM